MKRWMRTIGLALILSTLSLNLSALNTEAQTRPASVQSGYSLLERGWVNDAIETFRQALRSNPNSLDARLGLAIAYQRAGQDAEAWQTYQQVIAQDPENITALTAIGQLGSYRPEWQQQGIAALTTLLNLQPTDLAARSQRALLYGYQGLFVEAISDYEQVLPTNPSPNVVLEAAQIYTYSGDFATGLGLFEQYLAANQTVPDRALTAYAQALRETNQASTAVEVLTNRLRTLSDTDPVTFELRSALALAYQANQQPEQALASLDALRDQPNAQLPLARALSAIGRQTQDQTLYAEAANLYQQVLRQTQTPSSGLLTEIADVLSELPASRSEARQLYQQVLEQQSNQSIQLKLAWLNYQLGDLSRGEFQQQAQQIMQTLPATPAEQQQLAQALSQINPPDPVLLTAYQRLLESVNVPFLQFRIAQIQLQQGNPAAARTALSAYQQTPNGAIDPATELLFAEIERQEGNLTASAQRYEQIASRYANRPTEKAALRGLAGIRLAQGQSAEALRLYEQLQAAYPNDTALRLGSAAIAYRQQQLSTAAAEQVLADWLRVNTTDAGEVLSFPPELFLLVGELPPDPKRELLYDELLVVEPNNITVNRRWAQLWARRDPDKARARIAQLLNENPNSIDAYLVQGELAQAIGELELASQSYEAILAQQPDQPDALIALAGVRFQQKRYVEAEQLYRQAIAQRPEDVELRRVLADLNIAQDQPVAALQELRQLQPDVNRQINARIHRLQIEFLRRRGFQPEWERY